MVPYLSCVEKVSDFVTVAGVTMEPMGTKKVPGEQKKLLLLLEEEQML